MAGGGGEHEHRVGFCSGEPTDLARRPRGFELRRARRTAPPVDLSKPDRFAIRVAGRRFLHADPVPTHDKTHCDLAKRNPQSFYAWAVR